MYNLIDAPQVKLSYLSDFDFNLLPVITCSNDAEKIFRTQFDDGQIQYKECFYIALLNRSNKVLGITKISEGGISACYVDVRIILQAAILGNASGIVLCHNHPSGNLKPSEPDLQITKRIIESAKHLEFFIADHIILTKDSYFSFADNGLIYR